MIILSAFHCCVATLVFWGMEMEILAVITFSTQQFIGKLCMLVTNHGN